jgi:hypothetical protein
MSTTRDERIYAMYHAAKRRGEFYYDGHSPYLWIAQRFRVPIIQVRGIINEMKQRWREELEVRK